MTRQKGFSAIEVLVAIAFLAILAGGAWVWQRIGKPSQIQKSTTTSTTTPRVQEVTISITPTDQPSESLTTYTTTKMEKKFSFAYPSQNWFAKEDILADQRHHLSLNNYQDQERESTGLTEDQITINFFLRDNSSPMYEVAVENDNFFKQYARTGAVTRNDIPYEVALVTVGGQQGISYANTAFTPNTEPYIATTVLLNLGDVYLQIGYLASNQSSFDSNKEVFDQILSTFKFLD